MMGKHSKSWVSSCFPSPPPPPHHRLQDGPPSTSCSCHEVAETTCTIGLLFVCCPFSAVCCCVKVTRWLEVRFEHVYREQNKLADALAKKALCHPIHLYQLDEVPNDLWSLLHDDQLGATSLRRFSSVRR
nr:putative reverse transcriptase [Ipomoea batatas]